jgi:DNA-binding CsgD family transcriptional regulator
MELLNGLLFVGQESTDRDHEEIRAIAARIEEIAPDTPRGRLVRFNARLTLSQELGPEATIRTIEEFLSGAREAPLKISAASNLAFIYLAAGRVDDAIRVGTDAITLAIALGDPEFEAYARQTVAIALAERGDIREATDNLVRALAIAVALNTPLAVMDAVRSCGTFAAILGRPLDAAWLLGAAEAAFLPTPLGNPEDDVLSGSGAGRHWRAARKSADGVAWEVAHRDGLAASYRRAIERAYGVLSTDAGELSAPVTKLRHGVLTPREIEILTLVGEGRSDPEIAAKLFISRKTASVHVANIKAKLQATSRLDVALRARELRLVKPAERLT